MKCSDVMKQVVDVCRSHETVFDVATTMRDHRIGFMPVCDDSGKVIGVVTDRDLVVRGIAAERPAETTQVAEVMTPGVVSCRPWDDLHTAEQLMGRYCKSRIVCTDEQGKLEGVISLSDIATVEATPLAAEVLRSITARESRVH